jgi:hypothetical protein
MKSTRFFTVLFTLLLFSTCKTYTPDQLPPVQLQFGNGGGFTGIETSYTLLENGQIFKQSSIDSTATNLPSVKPKAAKALFAQLEAIGFDTLNINKPGNLYQFIQSKQDTLSHKVVWTPGTDQPVLDSLYKKMIQLVK